jgi:hypothetical protein
MRGQQPGLAHPTSARFIKLLPPEALKSLISEAR